MWHISCLKAIMTYYRFSFFKILLEHIRSSWKRHNQLEYNDHLEDISNGEMVVYVKIARPNFDEIPIKSISIKQLMKRL